MSERTIYFVETRDGAKAYLTEDEARLFSPYAPREVTLHGFDFVTRAEVDALATELRDRLDAMAAEDALVLGELGPELLADAAAAPACEHAWVYFAAPTPSTGAYKCQKCGEYSSLIACADCDTGVPLATTIAGEEDGVRICHDCATAHEQASEADALPVGEESP